MTRTEQTSLSTAGSHPRGRRALAVGGAVLATSLLWLVATILDVDLKVDMTNRQPPMVVGLPLVLIFSLVFSLLGWGMLALLEGHTGRARIIWTVLATAILLLSLMPIAFAAAAAGTKIILTLMHVTVAAVLIPTLPRHAPKQPTS